MISTFEYKWPPQGFSVWRIQIQFQFKTVDMVDMWDLQNCKSYAIVSGLPQGRNFNIVTNIKAIKFIFSGKDNKAITGLFCDRNDSKVGERFCRSPALFFQLFLKLFKILVSKDVPYFSFITHKKFCGPKVFPFHGKMKIIMVTIVFYIVKYRQLQFTKLLCASKWFDWFNWNFKYRPVEYRFPTLQMKPQFWIIGLGTF